MADAGVPSTRNSLWHRVKCLRSEYVDFLVAGLGNCGRVSRNGAVHFVCCDWRHVTDIIEAGRLVYDEVLNIVVWVKSNAGQGSFYRSRHEFIIVFRVGKVLRTSTTSSSAGTAARVRTCGITRA